MKQTMGRKLAFGVGGLGKDLCYAMISTYLTIYLTDTVGLAPCLWATCSWWPVCGTR